MSRHFYRFRIWRFAIAHPDNISIIDSNCDEWKKLFGWIFILTKLKAHSRETYCLGQLAFVKCMICGAESIPWEVSKDKADAWAETNGYKLKRLYEFEARRRLKLQPRDRGAELRGYDKVKERYCLGCLAPYPQEEMKPCPAFGFSRCPSCRDWSGMYQDGENEQALKESTGESNGN